MLDRPICTGNARSFEKTNDKEADSLSCALFKIEHVTSIFYVQECVTVNKAFDVSWEMLERQIALTIEENVDGVTDGSGRESEWGNGIGTPSNSLLEKINAALDEKIRPALAGDGGGLNVIGLDGFTLKIHYQGACGSCPSATTGTLMAIQDLLKKDVDERIQVSLA